MIFKSKNFNQQIILRLWFGFRCQNLGPSIDNEMKRLTIVTCWTNHREVHTDIYRYWSFGATVAFSLHNTTTEKNALTHIQIHIYGSSEPTNRSLTIQNLVYIWFEIYAFYLLCVLIVFCTNNSEFRLNCGGKLVYWRQIWIHFNEIGLNDSFIIRDWRFSSNLNAFSDKLPFIWTDKMTIEIPQDILDKLGKLNWNLCWWSAF